MTTIRDLIDYLEEYPHRMPVYLSYDYAPKDGSDYVLLDRMWFACELADQDDQLSLFEEDK